MGWRFRKSFKIFPGARINVSRRGLSATIGASPFSFNVGTRGAHLNINVPGTGLSYRHNLTAEKRSTGAIPIHGDGQPIVPSNSFPSLDQPPTPSYTTRPTVQPEEIRSASTFELTSDALRELQAILTEVDAEQQKLDAELSVAGPDWQRKKQKFERWNNGFLLKHVRKERFASLEEEAQVAREKLDELMEQRKLTCMATDIQIADELKPSFGKVFDAFTVMLGSKAIWDTISSQQTNRFRERTTAAASIERILVPFTVGQSDLLQSEWKVPCLGNANGGDLYLYPGFLLYRVSKQAFALLDYREVNIEFQPTQFIEEQQIPPDSQVVGHTWKFANKNGSPDRRFSNNYQIPIALYGQLSFTSPTGLNERYLISNCPSAERFARSWKEFRALLF